MGLAESAASDQRRDKSFLAELYRGPLARSPSAPVRVSTAPFPGMLASKSLTESDIQNSNVLVSSRELAADATARVAVLADGSCAFYKARRQPTSLFNLDDVPLIDEDVADSETDCYYTCHPQCRDMVCGAGTSSQSASHVQLQEIAAPSLEPELRVTQEASGKDLVGQIEWYNSSAPAGLTMALEEDGSTFRGFIRVHMNLCCPISVVAGTRPPSIYDILKDDETLEKTLTSFYLPRDTVKALHITSETTTNEVIAALLKKFKVVDNPRKFALYERYYEHGETAKVKMRRIADNEKPLVLALLWSCEKNCNKMFVLQENETGDILWEAFTLPELNNFLRILDREEEEYKKIVRQKYHIMAMKIQEAMEKVQPPLLKDDEAKPGDQQEGS